MSIIMQIQVDKNRYYQRNMELPNLLLMTPSGIALLKEEAKNNPLLPQSAIDSGSVLLGEEILIVGNNDLDGGIYKWIYSERK